MGPAALACNCCCSTRAAEAVTGEIAGEVRPGEDGSGCGATGSVVPISLLARFSRLVGGTAPGFGSGTTTGTSAVVVVVPTSLLASLARPLSCPPLPSPFLPLAAAAAAAASAASFCSLSSRCAAVNGTSRPRGLFGGTASTKRSSSTALAV